MPSSNRTVNLGYNVSAPMAQPYFPFWPVANWLKRAYLSSGVVTYTADFRPLTANGTSGAPAYFYITTDTFNYVDGGVLPQPTGTWTFVADDTNGVSPLNVSMTSGTSAIVTSGGSAPVTFTEGTHTTGVSAITLGSAGSGYTDTPTVTLAGGGGTGATAYAIVSNGSVVSVHIGAVGVGYSSNPTVSFSGGGGSGATANCTIGPVLSGRTWQFSINRSSASDRLDLRLNFWSNAGGTYPYTITHECLFSPSASAAAALGIPSRASALSIDPGMAKWLTTATPKYPAILRFMDSTEGYGGYCNVVEAEDLENANQMSWENNGVFSRNFVADADTKSHFHRDSDQNLRVVDDPGRVDRGYGRGSGYSGTVSVNFSGGGGSGAAATATVTNGVITGVSVTSAGTGYASAPLAAISTGGAAVLSPTIVAGGVVGVSVVGGGSGYTSTLPITISGGGGTGAAATATVTATGTITRDHGHGRRFGMCASTKRVFSCRRRSRRHGYRDGRLSDRCHRDSADGRRLRVCDGSDGQFLWRRWVGRGGHRDPHRQHCYRLDDHEYRFGIYVEPDR